MKTKKLLKTILNSCCTFLIGSAMYAQCNASFTYTTDTNCVTHFTNTSSGVNLDYEWFIPSVNVPFNVANPSVNLVYTTQPVTLFLYSGGVVCDSVTQNITINCATTNTTINCQAGFIVSTGTNCMTSFTNISSGANAYRLEYGDGNYYFGPTFSNLSYQYLNNGVYTATLSAFTNTNMPLTPCSTYTQAITIGCVPISNTVCPVSFTYSTDTNCITHFVNTTGCSYNAWEWIINGVHYYTSSNLDLALPNGTVYASLGACTVNNLCDSSYNYININCSGTNTTSTCHASFTTQTDPITCMTSLINQSTGNNLTYAWFDIDNGYTQISSSPNPSLLLSNGIHNIGLAVFSGGTLCDSSYQAINVNCPNTTGCQVTSSISLFADSANAGNFFCYNQSTGNGTLTYLWDFGDGTTSTLQYPFHQYAQPGNYPVCLTTTNTNGTLTCSSTDCDSSSVQRMAAGFLMSSINVIPQTVNGIKSVSSEDSFKTYPNPITDVLNIELAETNQTSYMVILVDAIGREVIKKELQANSDTINTSALQKGYYNLLLINEKGTVVKTIKLIK